MKDNCITNSITSGGESHAKNPVVNMVVGMVADKATEWGAHPNQLREEQSGKSFLPMTTAPNFDAIPQLLKDLKRWLCWQLQPAEPKLRKVPMTPKNGKLINASVTDPENWLTFDEAISWYNRGLCSGIGFVLTNNTPKVCCVDVDHCRNADGSLTDEAKAVMGICQNSFTEVSQSGDGAHVWFIDDDFDGGRKKGNVEVYATDRYIAMTGVRVQSSSTELLTVNGACRKVIAEFIGEREGNLFDKKSARTDKHDVGIVNTPAPLSEADRKLVEYFHSDKCRNRDVNMFELFCGDKENYFKNTGKPCDDSVADVDLMLKILYYIGNAGTDNEIGHRALKIFGQSALAKREKWQREDYQLRTLNAAFDIWNQNGRKSATPRRGDRANDGSTVRDDTFSGITTKDKIADCPVDLILPRDVLFNDEGITLKETRGEDKTRYITAATTPIVPTKILRNENSGLVQYELAIYTDGKWRRHVVDGRTIQSPRCVDKLANFGALIKPSPLCEYFTRIIAANGDRLKTWKIFAQPGWKDEKFQHFIYPTGGTDYIVGRSGYNYSADYAKRGNADEWKKLFATAIEHSGRIARIFCGVAVAAPLIRPLKITNMQAHLFGGVNSGKTMLARLIASIFGNPQELLRTFESSPKRRQADAAANNDMPTIYDELETVRGQRAEASLVQSVYAFFNGRGNQNLNVDGTARDTFKFTGSRLSTGERQILKVADQFGAYKRLVPLECKGKIFDKQLATQIYRFTADNFGHFGRGWTAYIAEHLNEIREKYEAKEQAILADEKHEETQLRTICAAGVAYQFFAMFLKLQNGFDERTFLDDVVATIEELPTVEESSDSTRAFEVLRDVVASNEDRFYRETNSTHAPRYHEFDPKATGEHWGKLYLDGAVAIYPTTLSDILIKKGFASPEMLIRTWNDEGKLVANDGRNTRRVRIGDARQRTIYFKAGTLSKGRDDVTNIEDEEPPTER